MARGAAIERSTRTREESGREKRGEEFEAFFASHYERLLKTMYILTRNPETAKDLAQEAMVRVFEHWEKMSSVEDPVAYLFRVAVNLNRRMLRRRILGSRYAKRLAGMPSVESDPHSATEIILAIGHLSRVQREALALVEWIGYSTEEAGRILGVKASSVRARIHRARAALREELGEQGNE